MNEVRKATALKAIEEERNYQDKKWPGFDHTPGEWVLILEKLCHDARTRYIHGGKIIKVVDGQEILGCGEEAALDEIRQIAATALAAMEQCGVIFRK